VKSRFRSSINTIPMPPEILRASPQDKLREPMHPYDPRTWHWDLLAAFGFLAQALFAARFIVQWISSERRKVSHVPVAFWYFSVCGGLLMTIYGVFRRDPVIVLGQAPALVVYIRNLMLIRRARLHAL
jgi:lipid-A-disaccharide synthase-like uncharacterized protein